MSHKWLAQIKSARALREPWLWLALNNIPCKWFLVYLNILTQSIAITDGMFNFGNFLTKNAITFDQKEIERKYLYLVGIKFCCASNAAIKNVKIARKKNHLFFQNIFNKIAILKKKDF